MSYPAPSERPPTLRLDTTTVGSRRGVGCLTGLAAVPVLVLLLLAVIGILGGGFDGDPGLIGLGVFILVLAAGAIVGVVFWARRCAAWLEGTMLVARGLFTTTRYDLATAEVGAESLPETVAVPTGSGVFPVATGRRIPLLAVRDVRTGRRTKLVLRPRRGGLLPPAQLVALAEAIQRGPRPHPYDQYAAQIAAGLRALAGNPFTGHV